MQMFYYTDTGYFKIYFKYLKCNRLWSFNVLFKTILYVGVHFDVDDIFSTSAKICNLFVESPKSTLFLGRVKISPR